MEYIAEILGVNVERMTWNQADKLPYLLLNEYRFELVKIGNANQGLEMESEQAQSRGDPTKDMEEQTLEGANLGGDLNAGLLMEPVEKAFDRLAGTRDTGVKGIAAKKLWRIPRLRLGRGKQTDAPLLQSFLPSGV